MYSLPSKGGFRWLKLESNSIRLEVLSLAVDLGEGLIFNVGFRLAHNVLTGIGLTKSFYSFM